MGSFLGFTDPFLEDDPWKHEGTSGDTSPVTTTSYEIVTDKSSSNSSPAKSSVKEDPDWPV